MNLKKMVLVVIVMISLSFCGCYDYSDIEESALVAGIAIDRGTGGYEVTTEILSMKSKSSADAVPNPLVITESAETIGGALDKMVNTNVRKLYFGHCVVVLLSKEVASEGIRDVVDFFFHDNRINVSLDMVVVKNGKAVDIFNCETTRASLVSFDISKALRETASENSTTKNVKVYECINAIENPGREVFLPVVMSTENGGKKRFSVSGIAVFKNEKLLGFLSEEESLYFLMLTDNLDGGSIELMIDGGEYVYLNMLSDTIDVGISSDDQFCVDINIALNLSLMNIPKCLDLTDPESTKDFEEVIAKKIEDKLQSCIVKIREGFRSDVLSYGYLFYRKFPSQFHDVFGKEGEFLDYLTFDFNISVNLRNSGFSDMPIRGDR